MWRRKRIVGLDETRLAEEAVEHTDSAAMDSWEARSKGWRKSVSVRLESFNRRIKVWDESLREIVDVPESAWYRVPVGAAVSCATKVSCTSPTFKIFPRPESGQ